jgi:hypothetical protein
MQAVELFKYLRSYPEPVECGTGTFEHALS